MNEDSILDTVKSIIGISLDDHDFDAQLILHINTVLSILNQLGVGEQGFCITGQDDTWEDLFDFKEEDMHAVKTYVALRVWIIFDAQGISSGTLTAIKEQIAELEWRINVAREEMET